MLGRKAIQITNRTFWTVSRGQAIGYIENVISSNGFIFKNPCIYFRETSSNLSNGQMIEISTVDIKDTAILMSYMKKRKPVCVTFNLQFFSSPTRGHIIGQNYATEIEEIKDENINVTVDK